MCSSEEVQQLIKKGIGGRSFIIVSNREPYIHIHNNGRINCVTPAGGLTAALDPLMQAVGGVWVAGGSGDADREVVDKKDCVKVPPARPKYTLKRVWMTKEEVDDFYFGFSNQTLWPLCHDVFVKPVFKKSFWEGYRHSNRLFSNAVLEHTNKEKAFIWFQDYHLALAPDMIRKKRPDTLTAHFWHIPWPNPETFSICPWAKKIMEGLLANDLIGFHIPSYCTRFLETAEFVLGADVDYDSRIIEYKGRKTKVKAFPISVDFSAINKAARTSEVKKEIGMIRSAGRVPYKHVAVGVDRIDYTKGIIERLRAIDRFLEKYPEFQGNFVYIQAGAPSRIRVPEYMRLNQKLVEIVEEINWKYQKGYWKPIRLNIEKMRYSSLLALYRDADACIVSPLHDGMNLVAKEFVAANVDNKGVLILSKFAGAIRELEEGSLVVNPYDTEHFADTLKEALGMRRPERRNRSKNLRNAVKRNNIYKWLRDFISEATNS